ncbi:MULTISPECIES: hypothetical protein [Persicobacter]|uniref:Uncharacterized protein n=1 Tax=Persicobacter diffluens TaxID=981 RepID=A0AAN4VX39_9BACT|nr:hypothetical protein [Persicobacter sp. CCB-QB2]GJM61313.1 hypothetical protein PEDI_18650 [Persicobacter diffluens]
MNINSQKIKEALEANLTLTLNAKKLKSGNFQIKFLIHQEEKELLYGYLLKEKAQSAMLQEEIVQEIEHRVLSICKDDYFQHSHLYGVGGKRKAEDFMIYMSA